MLSLPRPVKRLLVYFLDVFLCLFATWLALALHFDVGDIFGAVPLMPFVASLTIAPSIFYLFGLYHAIFRYPSHEILTQLSLALAFYALVYFALLSIVGFPGIPRSVGIVQPVFLLLFVGASRLGIGRLLGQEISRSRNSVLLGVLIYGVGDAGQQLANSLRTSTERRCVGFVDDDDEWRNSTINGVKVYSAKQLGSVIRKCNAAEIWLAMPSLFKSRKRPLIESLRDYPVRALTLPSLSDLISGKVQVSAM